MTGRNDWENISILGRAGGRRLSKGVRGRGKRGGQIRGRREWRLRAESKWWGDRRSGGKLGTERQQRCEAVAR